MAEFIDAAFSFPAAVLTYPLLVVVVFWLVVVAGAVEPGVLDGADVDAGAGVDSSPGGFAGFMASLGLGGVPVTAALSLLIFTAWAAMVGGRLLAGDAAAPILFALLVAGLVAGWLITRVLLVPLRGLVPANAPSRGDFVGKVCVIRTGRVTEDFGQAEVTAEDGSSAVVQVRMRDGEEPLAAGSTALIFDYDAVGEFFWVAPYDAELAP